jgi:glycosyltransferase involved in cell wall biosynthesis
LSSRVGFDIPASLIPEVNFMPLVSVLLPTYSRNASGHLRNAIMSVLEQDMPDLELFVIDDGSVDGSAATISEIASNDTRVHHLRFEENVGLPALTCGEAFRRSKGEFIAWQFDDCVWKPDLLSTLIQVAGEHPDSGMVYGQAQMNAGTSSSILGEAFDRETLLQRNIIPNCSTLIRREVFLKAGWLDPSVILKRICDYDMWIRVSEHFNITFFEKVVAIENGLSLPDSLGNSVTLVSSLAQKYREQDRTAYLQIENINAWNPYATSEWMDESEKEQTAQVICEHFLRTKKYPKAVSTVCEILPSKFSAVPVDEVGGSTRMTENVFAWYIDKLNEAKQKREVEAVEYIRNQSKYIEDQHAYIDRQHQMIHDLQAEVLSIKLSRWSALKRVFSLR